MTNGTGPNHRHSGDVKRSGVTPLSTVSWSTNYTRGSQGTPVRVDPWDPYSTTRVTRNLLRRIRFRGSPGYPWWVGGVRVRATGEGWSDSDEEKCPPGQLRVTFGSELRPVAVRLAGEETVAVTVQRKNRAKRGTDRPKDRFQDSDCLSSGHRESRKTHW